MWKLWLIAAGIFLIIEIVNLGFLIFWFSIGALVAMVASFFIDSVVIQTVIFLVSSTILLFATKPLVNKVLPKETVVKTNAYSVEGKIGKVIADIEPMEGKGQIKLDSEIWSAKSEDNTFIPKDTEVIIEKIDGVKAIVKPLIKN
jgi:membrane protein implicated in regulation of membrane protease activity